MSPASMSPKRSAIEGRRRELDRCQWPSALKLASPALKLITPFHLLLSIMGDIVAMNRLLGLDALRGLAAIIVLIGHISHNSGAGWYTGMYGLSVDFS